MECDQRGVRADFQPDIHAEFRQRLDGRRKTHGLRGCRVPSVRRRKSRPDGGRRSRC